MTIENTATRATDDYMYRHSKRGGHLWLERVFKNRTNPKRQFERPQVAPGFDAGSREIYVLEKERCGRSVTTIVAVVMENYHFRASSHKDIARVAHFDIRLHLGYPDKNTVISKYCGLLRSLDKGSLLVGAFHKAASWCMQSTENAERLSNEQLLRQYDCTMRWTKSQKDDAALHQLGCTMRISSHFKDGSFSATKFLSLPRIGLSQLGKQCRLG